MFSTLIVGAFAAGFGAFAGAMTAYLLACRKEKLRQKQEYLGLLIGESAGEKIVTFDLPLPDFPLNTEQMLTLMEVATDKQMPSALIHLRHFLQSHSRRVERDGVNVLSLQWVQQQATQLKFMLLSVRVQYEQVSNDTFPLEDSAGVKSPQK